MKAQLREKALQLRIEEELSYSAIQKKLNVSRSTLSYWLRGYPLDEKKILELRQKGWEKGEVARERYRCTMRKKKEAKILMVYEQQRRSLRYLSKETLFVAGLMLYLGEGSKTDPNKIALANTDVKIITFFIKWLEDFLMVRRTDIKIWLHLYPNMDIKEEKQYWQDKLDFSSEQFYKPYISKLRKASFIYRESYRHGTCTIMVNSVDKKMILMSSIRAVLDIYKEKKILRA